MAGTRGKPVEMIRNLARMLVLKPAGSEDASWLVYRVTQADEVRDSWKRRLIELADGRSISEIQETLYRQEIIGGASEVDIGMWKNLFDQSVLKTIDELANCGHVCLKLEGHQTGISRW